MLLSVSPGNALTLNRNSSKTFELIIKFYIISFKELADIMLVNAVIKNLVLFFSFFFLSKSPAVAM